jgi:hypothetical protein
VGWVAGDDTSVSVRIDGVREAQASLARVGDDADRALRDASWDLARAIAGRAAAAGRAEGRQAALVAGTVRVVGGGRFPSVVAGGSSRVGRRQAPAHKLLFGSEFGASTLRQYRPHLGSGSYWFLAAVSRERTRIAAAGQRAADQVADRFGGA